MRKRWTTPTPKNAEWLIHFQRWAKAYSQNRRAARFLASLRKNPKNIHLSRPKWEGYHRKLQITGFPGILTGYLKRMHQHRPVWNGHLKNPRLACFLSSLRVSLYNLRLPSRLQERIPSSFRIPLAGGAALLAMAVIIGFFAYGTKAYELDVNGQELALVAERQTAEETLADLSREAGGASYLEEVKIKQVRAKRSELSDGANVRRLLQDKLTFRVAAAELRVEGETVAYLRDRKAAAEALELLKERFTPKDQGVTVEKVAINEKIEIEEARTEAAKLWDPARVAEYLAQGKTVPQTYEVQKGDSLWTIARDNNTTVEELMAGNAGLKSEKIKPGQELNLVKVEPLANVEVTYREVKEENFSAPVKYQNDATLWRGQEKQLQGGQAGVKEVEYQVLASNGIVEDRTKLGEKVLREPAPKVVARGTRLMVASRGGGGSGRLGWPITGQITSGYGWRGREFHNAIDIAGRTGDPVYAAETGKVIFAAWSGAYGRQLAIDHGDGLVTRYNHLSAFKAPWGARCKEET